MSEELETVALASFVTRNKRKYLLGKVSSIDVSRDSDFVIVTAVVGNNYVAGTYDNNGDCIDYEKETMSIIASVAAEKDGVVTRFFAEKNNGVTRMYCASPVRKRRASQRVYGTHTKEALIKMLSDYAESKGFVILLEKAIATAGEGAK